MLARLLIAVLMVTGPLPVRICTCAAAHTHEPSTADTSLVAVPEDCCHCEHSSEPANALHDEGEEDHANGVMPTTHHDCDCPALLPDLKAPAVAAKLDLELAVDFSLTSAIDFVRHVGHDTRIIPHIEPFTHGTPRYILNLTLRN